MGNFAAAASERECDMAKLATTGTIEVAPGRKDQL